MNELENFRFNKFSQNGEDGVIQEILKRISLSTQLNNWCCEFGAWDGLHFSNTARLILEEDFRAVLIEGDESRLKDLRLNFPGDTVIKICSFVTATGETSLDNILNNTEIPVNFDFLSIDIDGMDYWIFKNLNHYKPKLICIEFNPSIPNDVIFFQEFNPKIKHGSSPRAISNLGQLMGYSVVSATTCNLLLVRNDLVGAVVESLPTLDDLIPNGNDPQYFFYGYDGSVLSNRSTVDLPWHGSFPINSFQILPKYLRRFSGDYTKFQKVCFQFLLYLKMDRNLKKLINGLRAIFK